MTVVRCMPKRLANSRIVILPLCAVARASASCLSPERRSVYDTGSRERVPLTGRLVGSGHTLGLG
jgi:hypothetical protein